VVVCYLARGPLGTVDDSNKVRFINVDWLATDIEVMFVLKTAYHKWS
jgi:hypothetical protein